MPNYIYRCPECECEIELARPMLDDQPVICPECEEFMQRKPQVIAVNWNGVPPSKQAEVTPAVREMINGAEERRDTGKRIF